MLKRLKMKVNKIGLSFIVVTIMLPLLCVAESLPSFHSKIIWPIPETVITKMQGVTWHQRYRCPSLKTLSYVKLSYWGFDHKTHQGVLIVAKRIAPQVVTIFKQLYHHKFPIYSMKPLYEFNGNDKLSMESNNTSAFNCRLLTGKKKSLSLHSYGLAIDINPLVNPYIRGDTVLPSNHIQTKKTAKPAEGKILYGDYVYSTFTKYGWSWGGDWCGMKDYQHFEKRRTLRKRRAGC